MNDDIPQIMDSLIDRLWRRKALYPLWRLLGANYRINGLTDGWHDCYDGLRDFRALCRDKLHEDELNDTNTLINRLGQVLDRTEMIQEIKQSIIENYPEISKLVDAEHRPPEGRGEAPRP